MHVRTLSCLIAKREERKKCFSSLSSLKAAAAAAALTGAGSLENLLLIGSVFDTVSYQPKGKQVKATDPSA